jgi:hypothetical protein
MRQYYPTLFLVFEIFITKCFSFLHSEQNEDYNIYTLGLYNVFSHIFL